MPVDSDLFDKPGRLLSVQPQSRDSPTHEAPGSPDEPYSGDSERLEISSMSACTTVETTATEATASAAACEDSSSVAVAHNEPEENHYESPVPSLDVREDMIHVCEEPSVLNLDGQQEAPQPHMTNGKAVTEVASAPPPPKASAETVSCETPSSLENHHMSEATAAAAADVVPPLKTVQAAEQEASTPILSTNTKYIVTAAGVGVCALLMAWKFKN